MTENIRAHLWVSGWVQGVFYRYSTREQAQILGLKGWVKNLNDGRVEAIIEGEKKQVEKLINWCHKGPPGARVDNVEIKFEEYKGEFTSFSIIH